MELNQTNIFQSVNGYTALHQAIKSGDQLKIDELLDTFQAKFDRVRDYLVSKFQWDPTDRIWLKKTILVAVSKDECQSAKELENHHLQTEDLKKALIVLLQHPVNDEEVAVLYPDETNRLKTCYLVRILIPNGFLTLNNTGSDGTHYTFIEVAASRGMTKVIDRLYESGAEIAIPNHNPLLAACKSREMDTVRMLLTEHFDHFDCTLRDLDQHNALIEAIRANCVEMFDFILPKMITYRQKHYGESESEAFNDIFRFENSHFIGQSILTHLRPGPLQDVIGEYVVLYRLDLNYQWENVAILAHLVLRKMAEDYCFEAIRKNPDLLGLVQYKTTTVVHYLIRSGYTNFLKEMYNQNPEVKIHFETDSGYNELRLALSAGNVEKIQFIMDHHLEFIMNDVEKLKAIVLCYQHYRYYRDYPSPKLMIQYFPDFQTEIEEVIRQQNIRRSTPGMEHAFTNFNLKVFADSIDLSSLQQPLNNIRGSNNQSLLHFAVYKDNASMVTQMLDAGCEFDALDNDGNHPIHFVKSVTVLNLLIDRHPDGKNLIHRANSAGHSVLHRVCSLRIDHGLLSALLERVIDCGADVHQLTCNGESAVFMVQNCSILDILRKRNISLDTVSSSGETALQRHLFDKNIKMANAIFHLVNQTSTFRDNAHKLLSAMMNIRNISPDFAYRDFLEKNPQTTKLLFDSVYQNSRKEASRLFAQSCCRAFDFIVEKFLDFDYDLDYNFKEERGCTPIVGLLHNLVPRTMVLVKRLLKKHVDLEIRNDWGRTALLTILQWFPSAKFYGYGFEIVQLLLDNGGHIEAADVDGNRPLHLAFAKSEWELVELLVQGGADLKARNKRGKIPCEMGPAVGQELFNFLR